MIGPSTVIGAMTSGRSMQERNSSANSQRRERTSCHPPRSSRHMPRFGVAAPAAARCRIAARNAALITKLIPSSSTATPGELTLMTKAAIGAPATYVEARTVCMSELAWRNWSAGTVAGTKPATAGTKSERAEPNTSPNRARCHTCAHPVSTTAATASWQLPHTRSENTSKRRRSNLSAHTPLSSVSATVGNCRAASTSANCAGPPPIRSTTNVSANNCSPSPTADVEYAVNSFLNSACARTPNPRNEAVNRHSCRCPVRPAPPRRSPEAQAAVR